MKGRVDGVWLYQRALGAMKGVPEAGAIAVENAR